MMPQDKDAQKFQWHIGGHACFQSIMHIISELETPEFQAPNHRSLRSRALDVLKKTMDTRGRDVTPMWNVINRIISNCLAKNTPAIFSSTSFPDMFSPAGVMPGVSSSITFPPQTVAQSLPVSGEPTTATVLPDLSDFGSLDMQDPTMAFDWVSEGNKLVTGYLLIFARNSGTLISLTLASIESYISIMHLFQIVTARPMGYPHLFPESNVLASGI